MACVEMPFVVHFGGLSFVFGVKYCVGVGFALVAIMPVREYTRQESKLQICQVVSLQVSRNFVPLLLPFESRSNS